MNIGTLELVIIVVLAIILYGKRLPEITRALGRGYQEFKKNIDNVKNDFQKQVEDSHPPDRLSRAGSVSKTDKYYADALSGGSAKENNSTNPDGFSEQEPGTGIYNNGCGCFINLGFGHI